MDISRRRLLAASSAGLAAASIGRSYAETPVVALRVSSAMPADENASHFAAFTQLQQRLKESVGDRIKVDFFPNSQLGKEADVVQQVKVGATDMLISGTSIWATVVPELGMLDLGYMFDSFDHLTRALDTGVSETLSKMLEARTGVNFVGWGFNFGARNVYTKKPVLKSADLKDLKLRVLPTPAFIQTFEAMGVIPTPIPVNELYTALQTGVVDGYEHDAGATLTQRFYEFAKNCFLTEHLFSPIVIAIAKRSLAKIPDDIRPTFLKVSAEAFKTERASAVAKASALMEELKKLGVVVTPMALDDRKAAQKAVADRLYAPFAEKYAATKPIFDMIAAARAG
jgi:TRAP-type transport system periplasmic protein